MFLQKSRAKKQPASETGELNKLAMVAFQWIALRNEL